MKRYVLYYAFLIAFVGLLISVFYGEILGIEPCRLCWYQRIAIAPLALFLGIAASRNERRLAIYTLPFAYFGAVVALYQSLTRLFPALHSSTICGAHHCNIGGIPPYFGLLGFIAIIYLIRKV
jgi:disulfide bond formation protein DsbB